MAGRGNPNWKKGVSGNVRGRPPGIVDRRQQMQKAIGEGADGLLAVIKAKALEGDMQAAGLLLSRLVPTLKPDGSLTQFELDVSAPLSQQIDQVMLALSQGLLTVENALSISRVLQARAEIAALERSGGDDDVVKAFREMATALGRPGTPYTPPAGTALSSDTPQAPAPQAPSALPK